MKSNEEVSTIEHEEKRLQELSLTPKAKMTEEERREYNKLHNRKSRRKTSTTEGMKKLLERAERAETLEQFWQLNRAEESPTQIETWLAEQEAIEDQLHWMAHYQEQIPSDDDYVSLADGIDIAEDTIQKNGFIKDAFSYTSRVLNEFEPMFAIWADRTLSDSYTKKHWGTVKPYWKDAKRLAALLEENEPTRIFALYGVRISLPEFHFLKFTGVWR
jgi:hypothetical protein